MSFDPEKATKSFRKLRKSLEKISKRPAPEQVHTLRTRSRRVEAIVHALMLDHQQEGKRLLKAIAPIRRKAGDVRDMDVLIGFATTLPHEDEDECLVQLVEHLGSERVRFVRKLRNTISAQRRRARRHLKQCSSLAGKKFADSDGNVAANRAVSADAIAAALEVWAELSAWPRLNASNLHPFRLKVKELRYLLQLTQHRNGKFLAELEKVKDVIGEWHDWNELAGIAASVLDHGTRCRLTKQIRSNARAKFGSALLAASAMREKYQNGNSGGKRILNDTAAV